MDDITRTEQVLRNISNQKHKIAPEVAKACQVKEFISDDRKNLLAEFMLPYLADNSAAAAETLARSNAEYLKRYEQLRVGFQSAMDSIKEDTALDTKFEAARSLLSRLKATITKFRE